MNRNARPLNEQVTMWATPRSCTAMAAEITTAAVKKSMTNFPNIETQVARTLWRSPNTIDAKGGTRMSDGQVQLCHQVKASGMTTTGSPEPTEKLGALNPEFVSWLMGYPAEWLSCAPSGTQSSRKSPRNSSKRTLKQKP